jgi:hypothetical protein
MFYPKIYRQEKNLYSKTHDSQVKEFKLQRLQGISAAKDL